MPRGFERPKLSASTDDDMWRSASHFFSLPRPPIASIDTGACTNSSTPSRSAQAFRLWIITRSRSASLKRSSSVAAAMITRSACRFVSPRIVRAMASSVERRTDASSLRVCDTSRTVERTMSCSSSWLGIGTVTTCASPARVGGSLSPRSTSTIAPKSPRAHSTASFSARAVRASPRCGPRS